MKKKSQQPKFGARVYRMGNKFLVKQTVLRGSPAEYVIDAHKEIHVKAEDDEALATAVRAATNGQL